MFNMNFTSVRELREWLDKKRCECEGPEEYDEWLQGFFDRGNTVTVRGEEYNYWACWELL